MDKISIDHESRISNIEGKIDLVIQNQEKSLSSQEEMMKLLRDGTTRITKLETEKDLLTRVGAPVLSFILAITGAYVGKKIP